MSIQVGTGSTPSNLVMAYDMNNIYKSYIGEPTTNTCSFGQYNFVNGNGTVTRNTTGPVGGPPPPVTGYEIAKLSSNDGSDVQTILYTATVDQVNGGVYTHSAWIYLEAGTYVKVGQHWNPWDYGVPNYIQPGVWTRVSYTLTNSTNNYGNIACAYNTDGIVYITATQYEKKSYMTGFTGSSRANTGALLDLTGTTNITATSLTYNSNRSFSFNGSSDKIYQTTIPSSYATVSNSLERTWEVVAKKTGTMSTAAIFGHKVGAGCSYFCNGGIYISNGNWAANWYDNSSYQFLDSGVPAVQGEYYHVVMTWTANSLRAKIYVNGVLKATSGVTNMNYGGSIAEYNIGWNSKNEYGGGGASDYFQGTIPVARYYSGKSLSDQEVQQNYNALKQSYWGNILDNGLILHLDATNPSSYPGAGTTWYDLSGSANHFTLRGSLTYSATSGFSGFSQNNHWYKPRFPTTLKTSQGGKGLTTVVYAKNNGSNGLWQKMIGNGDEQNYIDLYAAPGSTTYNSECGSTLYYNAGVNVSSGAFNIGDGVWRAYFATNSNSGLLTDPVDEFGIGGEGQADRNYPWNGNILAVLIYNRVLTTSEMAQVYNALSAKYGTP